MKKITIASLALLLIATPVFAQTRVASPYWEQKEQATNENIKVYEYLEKLPDIKANEVKNKWVFAQENAKLNRLVTNITSDFRDSEEYQKAYQEVKTSYVEYNKARDTALAGIRNSVNYQAAESLRANLSEQLKDAHAEKEPDLNRVIALAELKRDYILPLRKEEVAVLEKSGDVNKAKATFVESQRKLSVLERNFARKVRDNEQVRSQIDKVQNARIDKIVSAAYSEEAGKVKSILIDKSQPRFSNYSPYGNYSWGWGNYGFFR